MFNKLRTVIYHVADLQKAKDWYIALTGVQPYFDEPFYVGFDINGFELGLDPDNNSVTAKGNQSVAYWSVDDIHASFNKCIAAGASIISPITNVGGTIEVAVVQDPFGNAIGIISGA
jgi:predicted enzyme related to lactoylglutathione lyase